MINVNVLIGRKIWTRKLKGNVVTDVVPMFNQAGDFAGVAGHVMYKGERKTFIVPVGSKITIR